MEGYKIALVVIVGIISIISLTLVIIKSIRDNQYRSLTYQIQEYLGINEWEYLGFDDFITAKSSRGVDNYDPLQYFMENRDRVQKVEQYLHLKEQYADILTAFLENNDFINRPMYDRVAEDIRKNISKCHTYDVLLKYVSPAGKSSKTRTISYDNRYIQKLKADPSLLMSKSEYSAYIKEQSKEQLESKRHDLYDAINKVVDYANKYKDKIIITGDKEEIDKKIASLFDRTINNIRKIKDANSEEWGILYDYIKSVGNEIQDIVHRSYQIYEYYKSPEFEQIKLACSALMNSQKEFNEYINEKTQAISNMFGTRVIRNETVEEDEYNYLRPYKKTITPFTAEVSAQVFASAENNPIEYVVKYFYPNKDIYPDQIQKLQMLIEELETLKEARNIIDAYKKEYQQYLVNVPHYVISNDEAGFYSRLGFADISESALTVEYRFSYTSNGGFTQRTFTVPMTEETIIELINALQNKLTISSFTKEQRSLMTSKMRQQIKERDNFTCKFCGNSIYKEPNLLLEVDHIIPVAKGGYTREDNLQTLCWKCNRNKGSKLI